MSITSFGDMAHSVFLRSRTAELKESLATLTDELSTGQASDLSVKLGGDYTYLMDIDRSISLLESFEVATTESSFFASSAQMLIANIGENASSLSNDILATTGTTNEDNIDLLSSQSRLYLEETIQSLNAQVAGRSLFAGTATTVVPLAGVDTLMSSLVTEVSGLTTAADIMTAVKDWFDDPTGFDTVMYQGSTTSMGSVSIGPNEQVNIALRADDEDFKQAMQSFAIGALATESGLSLAIDITSDLISGTGGELLDTNNRLISVQADLGFTEARIEEAAVRNAATATSLSITRNELTQADPFETATRLEETQYQLEALYTVTARSNQLSLLSFM
ncbi:flagellar biosynthesis protein FlgL [Parasedimentitalea marina]|uniref:Flagellar biosynthesis protein FlgL n=1 Tax=Parasedimentitalea marina TaxID=2483033 RepID=A0A3T0N7U7_9RHOB|nr:flagellin [Parasedimentitalea marina]AZV80110.1 flagellar biosynthesis protein FlgL [Parasedimentitalea marina]